MDNYKITQYSVSNILNYVEHSQIAIPEIQRPFVWKGKEVRDLIDSLYEGYPIGYLIVWQNSQVRIRGFGKGGVKKILIDGQQRVTALMASLLGMEVLDEQYQSKRIKIAFNPLGESSEDRFAVSDESYEQDPKWISDISVLFKRGFSYRTFEKEYKEKNPGLDFSGLESAIDQLKGIIKHQVGIIELSFMLDIDVVSEIFIRINLQGKPLNQEDFVMSKISVNEQYHGDDIRNTIDFFCHLLKDPSFLNILKEKEPAFMANEYGKSLAWCGSPVDTAYVPSYADVLKVVLISAFGKSKIGDLVNLLSGKIDHKTEVSKALSKESFEKLGRGVKAFVDEKNFKGYLAALKKAGYGNGRLYYSQAVMNYCYAMYLIMDEKGYSEEEKASMIGRWMTMSLLTGHYQSSPDSVVVRDVANIEAEGFASYLKQIEELQLGPDFFDGVLPEKFASTNTRTAAYLAFVAAMSKMGTLSLYSKTESLESLYENKAESYQILPKTYLAKCGYKTRETYGQIANITYISPDVKTVIKKKKAADYEKALLELLNEEEIKASLSANAIPEDLFAVEDDKVEDFLARRRALMAAKMKDYYYSL